MHGKTFLDDMMLNPLSLGAGGRQNERRAWMDKIQARQQALVDQLKQQGCITTPLIEQAFLSVPRHLFLHGEPLIKVFKAD